MPVSRQRVRGFYDARMSRNPELIAQFLHDDVEWAVAGPVDLIPFCGQHRGKQAALDAMVRVAPSVFRVTKLNLDEVLVDGDRAAGFSRLFAVQSGTGRTITYQRAEFFRFRDNRIMSYRAILDSFDLTRHWARRRISPQADRALSALRELTLRYAVWAFGFCQQIGSVLSLPLRFGGRQFTRPTVQRRLGLRNGPVASAVPLHRLRNAWFPRGTHGDLPGRIFYFNRCKILGGRNCSTKAR
jgi:ketosteroid isomerase-like protein